MSATWFALFMNLFALTLASRARLRWRHRLPGMGGVLLCSMLLICGCSSKPCGEGWPEGSAPSRPATSPTVETRSESVSPAPSFEQCGPAMEEKRRCLLNGQAWVWTDVCAGYCTDRIPR